MITPGEWIWKKIDEITQKNIEIGRFKKIINDINELKNLEKKLKQTQTQNNENKKEINIKIDILKSQMLDKINIFIMVL